MGSLVLVMMLCLIVIFLGMGGKASIINGPVISFEITQQGSNGLYLLYLMAVYLAVFAVSMLITEHFTACPIENLDLKFLVSLKFQLI